MNSGNLRIKRRYLQYMKQAKRYSDDTIVAHERAVEFWEIFTHDRDYRRITVKQAGEFSDWLKGRTVRGELLSATTRYHTVRLVKAFFVWLASQPGRNSKAITVALSYLTVERETVAEATSPGRRKVPTLDYIKALVDSIRGDDEISMRDRAMIAFLLLSGARASAVATLRLGCFDRKRCVVYQDPRLGVKTKNRKFIKTTLVPLDQSLLGHFLKWVDYLRQVKLWGDEAPIFPRTRVIQPGGGLSYEAAGVEPVFWKEGSRVDQIIKARATKAELEPYDCHSFRHTHVRLSYSKARTGDEQKAISQNIGHSHMATTTSIYLHLPDDQVEEIISGLDGDSPEANEMTPDEIRVWRKMVKRFRLTDDEI